jgi:dTDP-4-dehydrorhamnose reductase
VNARVLITGAGGQLAGAIAAEYARHADVLALGRTDLDITKPVSVREQVAGFRPTIIVNCAAFNRVDDAEDEAEAALDVNAFGVGALSRSAAEHQATLVHFSTDFVFDGTASQPYTEEDLPNPASVYAASKLLGEWFALEAPNSYVLRVASLFGGTPSKGSVDRIVTSVMAGEEMRVFVDRTSSPTYVHDAAVATRVIVDRGEPGLYHCVGSGSCTWYELGMEAARILGREGTAQLIPARAAEARLRALRPQYAALSNAKLTQIVAMPTWRDALARYIDERLKRR